MKHLKVGFVVLSLAVVSFFYYTASASGQEKTITLSYSTVFPAPHKMGLLSDAWGKEIEKRTNGMIKVRIFYGGTLTPPDKGFDYVVKGISDIAVVAPSYTVGRFPLLEVFDYPLGYTSSVNATRLVNEFYNKFKPKELDEAKVLYFINSTGAGLHTNKAVNKMEDLKGMKIRSTGTTAKVVDALGGIPVALPIGDTYDGLSRGVINGIMAMVEALEGWKFAEVTKYTTEAKSANVAILMCIVMNKAKWNTIPADAQKIIEEVNAEWIEKTAKSWDEMERSARDFSLKLGHNFIRVSKEEDARWAKTIEPLFDEYVKEKKAKGLPAEEVLKFSRERLEQLQ